MIDEVTGDSECGPNYTENDAINGGQVCQAWDIGGHYEGRFHRGGIPPTAPSMVLLGLTSDRVCDAQGIALRNRPRADPGNDHGQ